MTSTLKQPSFLKRASAMNRDELRARLRQQAGKRLDLVRYRLGLRRWTPQAPAPASAIPAFFFSADEIPTLVNLIRERLPEEATSIVEEANEICLHRFRLLGYNALDYGPEIDWHLDAAHGKRAPLRAGYRINFLDFDRVGDHKVTWELNRHQHLVKLAKAWLLTGDPRYTGELCTEWYSWQRANPYPMGINWASSLEAGFRSLSWLWVRELLAGCPDCPPSLAGDLLRGLAIHGRYIERNLSTYFSPNTHLLGEGVALFFIGVLCPQIPDAVRWRDIGWRIVIEEAAHQVRPDGVHFEQSLHYHVYALDFFIHARQLAVRNEVEMPDELDRTILKMLEVVHALAQAAPPEGFGDDDGGRVFNPRRNRTECMTDPLALGAGIFARPEFKATAGLTEEAIWLLGAEDVSLFDALRDCRARAESRAFDVSGIYVMGSERAGCQPLQLAIDAGPQGWGRCGHGHADALSVRAGIAGRRWLIDPGTFGYRAGPDRDMFRGTSAHNTLRVDGQDQAVPEGPFAWSDTPSVQVERWLSGAGFTLFAGNHTGYQRLPDPVLHRRFIFQVGDADESFWLVRDIAEGRDEHRLEVVWHFDADVSIAWAGEAFVATAAQGEHLTLMGARDSGWTRELTSGYVSPAYGAKLAAPLVRFGTQSRLPAECATLILPGIAEPGAVFGRMGPDPGGESSAVSAYRYQDSRVRREFLFAKDEIAWTFGAWNSDARIVYVGFDGNRLEHLVLVDGSFVEFEGEDLARCPRRVPRFELIRVDGQLQTFPPGDVRA